MPKWLLLLRDRAGLFLSLFNGRIPKGMNLGQWGEELAATHLQRKGYKILGRNVKLGKYEIDIITLKGDTTAFVEVKTRQHDDFAEPEANVDEKKKDHIRRAAHYYISNKDDPEMYYRFDVVAVIAPARGKPTITIYYDAFTDES